MDTKNRQSRDKAATKGIRPPTEGIKPPTGVSLRESVGYLSDGVVAVELPE
jgi:hypothetical protein